MFDLKGQVAVVTGASAGLGEQFALALAKQGADVALLARRAEKLEEVAELIRKETGVRALPVVCDVTNPSDIRNAVEAVISEYGKVDILVNNAGRGYPSPLEDYPDEGWHLVTALSLDAVMMCTREFGKEMLKKNYGRIINIASVLGLGGLREVHVAAYHACKGAVVSFTKAAAAEWAQTGITVNCIAPGFFDSQANSPEKMDAMRPWIESHTPMGRPGRSGELDSTVCYLAARESSYVTGTIIPCDGGWTCV